MVALTRLSIQHKEGIEPRCESGGKEEAFGVRGHRYGERECEKEEVGKVDAKKIERYKSHNRGS